MRLILGSASPRRLELLAQLGAVPDEVRAPQVDETPSAAEMPWDYCRRIVVEKLASIDCGADEIVLCADTTVAVGRRIMGKPVDAAQAADFLTRLSGRRHRAITAVGVKNASRSWVKNVVTIVKMKRLSDAELYRYLASGDWKGKAGGYAIQGPAGAFIPWISGSYTGVMGLPVAETAALLSAAGYDWADP